MKPVNRDSESGTIKLPSALAGRQSLACATQMFGTWAVEPKWFARAMSAVQAGHLKPKASADDAPGEGGEEASYQMLPGGLAVIAIHGHMQKGESSFGGCSTVNARRLVRAAADDWMVKGIVMYISSPGGTAAGTMELADDVKAADKKKPVYAYIEDIGASAAYWVASQTRKIFSNATAIVGSIGTYTLLCDDTAWQKEAGIRWQVVASAPYKGLGADGQVSDALVADTQREINELNAVFLASVSKGRAGKIESIEKVADGRCHVGQQALNLGLVDAVMNFDDAVSEMVASLATPSTSPTVLPESGRVNQSRHRPSESEHEMSEQRRNELLGMSSMGREVLKSSTTSQPLASSPRAVEEQGGRPRLPAGQLHARDATPPKAVNPSSTSDTVMTPERRRELLGYSTVGQSVLRADGSSGGVRPVQQNAGRATGDVPMSEERRRELLGCSSFGQSVLRAEDRAASQPASRVGTNGANASEQTMSEERRVELLGLTSQGRAVLTSAQQASPSSASGGTANRANGD